MEIRKELKEGKKSKLYGVDVFHETENGRLLTVVKKGNEIFITRHGKERVEGRNLEKFTMSVPAGEREELIAHLYFQIKEPNPLYKLLEGNWLAEKITPELMKVKYAVLRRIPAEVATGTRKRTKYVDDIGFAVDKEYRSSGGRGLRLGTELMNILKSHARQKGCHSILLKGPDVYSKDFYRKHGFFETDPDLPRLTDMIHILAKKRKKNE